MPNPPAAGLPNPQSYDTGTPDIVADRVTGLVWQRNIAATALSWTEAGAYCASLRTAGASDWRLPALIELTSIVDFTRVVPAIDQAAFPDAVQGNFWTSTGVAGNAGEAWYLGFSTGFNYQGHKEFLRIETRCVRDPATRTSPTGSHYSFPTTGVVRDDQTGLVWQRTAPPTTYPWAEATKYCQTLDLAGGGWRLPSMKELQTLVDSARQTPAIDLAAFPGSPMEQFWSSSPLAGSSTDAWFVSFRYGAVNPTARDGSSFVRCVR